MIYNFLFDCISCTSEVIKTLFFSGKGTVLNCEQKQTISWELNCNKRMKDKPELERRLKRTLTQAKAQEGVFNNMTW